MRLSKITIENFRGIRHAEVELDPEITVLVGENNAGKTSVLEALRLCLDVVKSDKTCNFTEFDFHRDEARGEVVSCDPISITLSFLEPEGEPWPKSITRPLGEVIVVGARRAIRLRVTAQFDTETGKPTQNWGFLDEAGGDLLKRPDVHRAFRALRQLRPFFYQTALRAARDQFHGQSTYWASFLGNKDIDAATQKALEEELHQVNQKIVDAHTSFQDVVAEVERISDLVAVGKADAVTVDPSPADIHKALRYTDVNLLTASNAKIPIRSHGEGTQSLSVLLLFSAYLKTRIQADIDRNAEPIIAIEEPEAHLHPNAIRAVWHLLDGLPGQKVVATHSGDILSEVPISKLRRMSRGGDITHCQSVPAGLLDEKEAGKFNHHVRRNRGELLFARHWLLVEGETDVEVFARCAEILDIDLHRNGVRIVECSQAGGPGAFIKVADALGIQWHLVADGDEGENKFVQSAKQYLDGRSEDGFISILAPNMDVLLCRSGYGQPYRDGVGHQQQAQLDGLEIDSQEYWERVYAIVKDRRGFSKPAAAMDAMEIMAGRGKEGVPDEIKCILEAINLAGESPV